MENIEYLIKQYLDDEIGKFQKLKFKDFSDKFIRIIREKYGKYNQPRSTELGTHPDYKNNIDLVKEGHVVSFFADIAGSTTMSANLPPLTVLSIKKVVLSIFSQVVIALDGHVHRLQGDAIMAFFNWNNMKHSESIWNAMFASIEILSIVRKVLSPFIEEEIKKQKQLKQNIKTPNKIAVRVGIDYGTKEATVWSKLGITNNFSSTDVYEHTAIGVNVSLASKIQNKIGKNRVGIGENAYNKIGLDDEYLEVNENTEGKDYYVINNPSYSYRILNHEKLSSDISDFSNLNSELRKVSS